jgi:hypothetical protein
VRSVHHLDTQNFGLRGVGHGLRVVTNKTSMSLGHAMLLTTHGRVPNVEVIHACHTLFVCFYFWHNKILLLDTGTYITLEQKGETPFDIRLFVSILWYDEILLTGMAQRHQHTHKSSLFYKSVFDKRVVGFNCGWPRELKIL